MFFTRKRFEEEVCRRMNEEEKERWMRERFYNIETRIEDLENRVRDLQKAVYGKAETGTNIREAMTCECVKPAR